MLGREGIVRGDAEFSSPRYQGGAWGALRCCAGKGSRGATGGQAFAASRQLGEQHGCCTGRAVQQGSEAEVYRGRFTRGDALMRSRVGRKRRDREGR